MSIPVNNFSTPINQNILPAYVQQAGNFTLQNISSNPIFYQLVIMRVNASAKASVNMENRAFLKYHLIEAARASAAEAEGKEKLARRLHAATKMRLSTCRTMSCGSSQSYLPFRRENRCNRSSMGSSKQSKNTNQP